jgi:putative transposase
MTGKIGAGDFGRIHRLCKYLDSLYPRISRAKCGQKRRLMKAAVRIREKIKNLINEIHHKTALFLCKTFDVVFLPSFESSRMVTKLHSRMARAMLTWAHYRFAEFLKHKAGESGTRVVRVCEAYTSKTCSACGKIHKIGSKKVMNCPACGTVLDRDVNGARGIFLRALGDTPSLSQN